MRHKSASLSSRALDRESAVVWDIIGAASFFARARDGLLVARRTIDVFDFGVAFRAYQTLSEYIENRVIVLDDDDNRDLEALVRDIVLNWGSTSDLADQVSGRPIVDRLIRVNFGSDRSGVFKNDEYSIAQRFLRTLVGSMSGGTELKLERNGVVLMLNIERPETMRALDLVREFEFYHRRLVAACVDGSYIRACCGHFSDFLRRKISREQMIEAISVYGISFLSIDFVSAIFAGLFKFPLAPGASLDADGMEVDQAEPVRSYLEESVSRQALDIGMFFGIGEGTEVRFKGIGALN